MCPPNVIHRSKLRPSIDHLQLRAMLLPRLVGLAPIAVFGDQVAVGNDLQRATTITSREQRSKAKFANSCAATVPTCDGGRITTVNWSPKYLEAGSACRWHFGSGNRPVDFRTADIARTTARARRTHSAGNCRLCPTEPVGNASDKDLWREPQPMEKVRRLGDAKYRAALKKRGSLIQALGPAAY